MLNKDFSFSEKNPQLVSDGLGQSPLCHKFATFPPQTKQESNRSSAKYDDLHHTILSDLAPLATDLGLRFAHTQKCYDYEQAHQELVDIHKSLRIGDLNLCDNSQELKIKASGYAARCRLLRQQLKNTEHTYQCCEHLVKHYQLTPPSIKQGDLIPALNRMCCERWWFRKIKILRLRRIETVARNIELVNHSRSSYASYHAIRLNKHQKAQNRIYLASTVITNENGETYTLQDLADRSVSNPAIRRAELMVRITGFEVVAGLLGHVGEFYTLTTPSRMHACLKHGANNPKYDGTTPKQAQDYLTHLWALMRSELHRQGINLYGFRVVEPHHDGTPHWHLMLFMPEEQKTIVRRVMQHYAFLDTPNELGAKEHRFKAINIDPDKGTAAGYIAKYIAKNIDGYGLNQTPDDKTASETAERIITWANTWGIRQFQQIGGPSVTVWRQLRRLDKVEDEELEQVRIAATANDWAAFMLAMGGVGLPRKNHLIKPYYDYGWYLHQETGEITQTTENRYLESSHQRIVGVIAKGIAYDSRKHYWTVNTRAAGSLLNSSLPRRLRAMSSTARGSNPTGGNLNQWEIQWAEFQRSADRAPRESGDTIMQTRCSSENCPLPDSSPKRGGGRAGQFLDLDLDLDLYQ